MLNGSIGDVGLPGPSWSSNTTRPPGFVHGMDADLVTATWPSLSDCEVRAVLAFYRRRLGPATQDSHVIWHSPRPMSAAGLVEAGSEVVFVKRHHPAVRSSDSLRTEHAFAQHLRRHGIEVPQVLIADSGSTVVEVAGKCYEVHEQAQGVDVYAEVPSWRPYASTTHAISAGAALARFHSAAESFNAPARPFGPLMSSVAIVASRDPRSAFERLLTERPALAMALTRLEMRDWLTGDCLSTALRASQALRSLARCWSHGDWHPSNLTWSRSDTTATVVSIIDLGLANRTVELHDIAVALERSCIDWLARVGAPSVDIPALDGFLDGYNAARPVDGRALADILPACHMEYALSEVEYFSAVAGSETNATLAARQYLIGHCRFFEDANGAALLDHLRQRG